MQNTGFAYNNKKIFSWPYFPAIIVLSLGVGQQIGVRIGTGVPNLWPMTF